MADVSAGLCQNIKSKKNAKMRCSNPASHGSYCGIHYKHPVLWSPDAPDTIGQRVCRRRRTATTAIEHNACVIKIQQWITPLLKSQKTKRHGVGYYARSICTNETDFFSTDLITDISGEMFFSFVDVDTHVYGFDLRSVNTIVQKSRIAGTIPPLNPYNRNEIPGFVLEKIAAMVRWLNMRHLPTEWESLVPSTPEQQIRMKIVDLFSKIDELSYYTSPDWFINLDTREHRMFYREIYNIWTERAGLSSVEKNTIVPNFPGKLFRHAPWALIDGTVESYQKLNMNVIRILITSATDRNDRIIGAMYVVTALTKVSVGARRAYPWLYESLTGFEPDMFAALPIQRFGNLFANMFPALPPPLTLPPPLALVPYE